uniref:EIF-4F 25 kDa subunit n=1 Tax=Meloidogyne incognita TaxID=6306 RepID=A0A914KG94_MELIC
MTKSLKKNSSNKLLIMLFLLKEGKQNLNNNNNNTSSTTQIPIISSPPQLNINNLSLSTTSKLRQEHRLKTRWTFWFLNSDRELTWLERLKKVCTIESAEAFWALYDNIRPPSAMQSGCDYNFFKEGIQPVWEVPDNKNGGRLIVQIDNKNKIEHLDALWLELLVALIGEQFGRDSEYICGAVCNMRGKGHKICLWTKDAEAEEANRRIGAILKDRFQDITNCSIRVNYEEHNVSQHKSSSATQVRFVL